MSENLLPPEVAADPGRSHMVFEWTVPMRHGDTTVVVDGELTWNPPPPSWLVWSVYAGLALLAVAAGQLFRTPRLLGTLLPR
jgi:hypothetical protein